MGNCINLVKDHVVHCFTFHFIQHQHLNILSYREVNLKYINIESIIIYKKHMMRICLRNTWISSYIKYAWDPLWLWLSYHLGNEMFVLYLSTPCLTFHSSFIILWDRIMEDNIRNIMLSLSFSIANICIYKQNWERVDK